MTMQYIRDAYDVPAKEGGKVIYTPYGMMGPHHMGVIICAHGARLKIRMSAYEKAKYYHPTWAIRYL